MSKITLEAVIAAHFPAGARVGRHVFYFNEMEIRLWKNSQRSQ